MGKEEKISPELARVHAHLCGDGYTYFAKTKEKDRNFTAIIGYCNNNKKLLDKFRKDFMELFGVKMTMKRGNELRVRSIRIFKELENMFGDFGSRKWRIHNSIMNSNDEIKIEWLKAFFEDEAYYEKRYNRLKTKSMNLEGLKDVQKILTSLNIFSSLTGPNCDGSYYITIRQFDKAKQFSDFVKEPVRK